MDIPLKVILAFKHRDFFLKNGKQCYHFCLLKWGKTYLKTSHWQSSSFCLGNYTNEELINSSTGKFVPFCDCAIYWKSFSHHLPFYYVCIVLTLKAYRENNRSLRSRDTAIYLFSKSNVCRPFHALIDSLACSSSLLSPRDFITPEDAISIINSVLPMSSQDRGGW